MMAGMIQLLMGFMRLGVVVSFLAHPVWEIKSIQTKKTVHSHSHLNWLFFFKKKKKDYCWIHYCGWSYYCRISTQAHFWCQNSSCSNCFRDSLRNWSSIGQRQSQYGWIQRIGISHWRVLHYLSLRVNIWIFF